MSTDAEHWEQLQALFYLAEKTPETEIDALLLETCPDAELRRRAGALIRASREKTAPPLPVSRAGGKIGPYTMLRHLGSGGIGSVYLVERTTAGVVQKSALKVLTRSAAGPFFTARFAREQHILASLDHPNITRMLDAGLSEDGEPYLTMEYVDGAHLDAYCDERSLAIPERLQLFLRVCEAVAYAHRNLVVHLDLKPSNILITETGGIVKLLDFGTSKLIQPDSLLTTTVMATPAYASPEQLRNEPVTTVCDVYALGAVLFELLSGRRPNQDISVAMMIERSMKELPSDSITTAVTAAAAEHRGLTETRLRSLLAGDLATIVAKCINPRPKDRYVTVDTLIDDVQRYLAGRPILARPQTTTYRLSKFVRRNRTAFLSTGVLLLCLFAAVGYAGWRQQQAYREGRRAMQMQTFMTEVFKLANTHYMGKPAATVPELLQLGVKLTPDLIKDPVDRRAAQLSLAKSMYDNNDFGLAQAVFAEVIKNAKQAEDLARLAEAESYAGKIAYQTGNSDAGAALSADSLRLDHSPGVTPAVRIRIITDSVQNRVDLGNRKPEDEILLRSAVSESRDRSVSERERAEAIGSLAYYLSATDKLSEAKALSMQALAVYLSEPFAFCDRAAMHTLLANLQSQSGDSAGSIPLYRQAYTESRSCSGDASEPTFATQVMMARAMIKSGQAQNAIPVLESLIPTWQKAYPSSLDLRVPFSFLARAYLQTSQFEKAELAARQALQLQEGKINPNTVNVAVSEFWLAQALKGEGRNAEALQHAETSDREYAAVATISTVEKVYAVQAHELVLDLQKDQHLK
jgi:serine/threonine protein kinase/tetratricopeptide (TPR) repeat protein